MPGLFDKKKVKMVLKIEMPFFGAWIWNGIWTTYTFHLKYKQTYHTYITKQYGTICNTFLLHKQQIH